METAHSVLSGLLMNLTIKKYDRRPILEPVTPTSDIVFRWTPYPVLVVLRDNKDYTRVLFYSYYTTITG